MKDILLLAAALAAIPRPEFEVATIKPNHSGGGRSSTRLTPGAVFIENAPLRKCIALAYDANEDRDDAIAGPDWLRFERYDIVAQFPPGTLLEQVRAMFQSLLADRFKLRMHTESRERPVYALVLGKKGPKLRESAPDARAEFNTSAGHLAVRAGTTAALADRLSSAVFQLDRPVLDRTGLEGAWDFTLDWIPESARDPDAAGPSLFTALEEQLGLKIEAQKGRVEILVVDSIERRPTAN